MHMYEVLIPYKNSGGLIICVIFRQLSLIFHASVSSLTSRINNKAYLILLEELSEMIKAFSAILGQEYLLNKDWL